jgi:hypothetical protein
MAKNLCCQHMKKRQNLRIVLSSSLVVLSLWHIPAVQAQICTREYAPVCGQIADQASQTFPNRCTLNNAQARPIAQGECPRSTLPQPVPQVPPKYPIWQRISSVYPQCSPSEYVQWIDTNWGWIGCPQSYTTLDFLCSLSS